MIFIDIGTHVLIFPRFFFPPFTKFTLFFPHCVQFTVLTPSEKLSTKSNVLRHSDAHNNMKSEYVVCVDQIRFDVDDWL